MSSFNYDRMKSLTKSPKRITITIPYSTFQAIVERSNEEGRSLSNLAAFILEQGVQK
jgi:hypothetical protein